MDSKALGKRIDDAITRAGLTRESAAEKAGVGQGAIYKWLRGEAFPKADNLRALCVALDVDPAELLDIEPAPIKKLRDEAQAKLERELRDVPADVVAARKSWYYAREHNPRTFWAINVLLALAVADPRLEECIVGLAEILSGRPTPETRRKRHPKSQETPRYRVGADRQNQET